MAKIIDFKDAKEKTIQGKARLKKLEAQSDPKASLRSAVDHLLRQAMEGLQADRAGDSKFQAIATVEMMDSPTQLIVRFALPGVTKDQIRLEFASSFLRVGVMPIENGSTHAIPKLASSREPIIHNLPLPQIVDELNVSATFENETLVVTFQKKPLPEQNFRPIKID